MGAPKGLHFPLQPSDCGWDTDLGVGGNFGFIPLSMQGPRMGPWGCQHQNVSHLPLSTDTQPTLAGAVAVVLVCPGAQGVKDMKHGTGLWLHTVLLYSGAGALGAALLLAWLQHSNHQAFPKKVCSRGPAEIIFFELTSLLPKTEK